MTYYFDASDGCERCEAMEGYYDEEPTPPHPNCDCEITEEEDDIDTADVGDFTIEVDDVVRDDSESPDPPQFHWDVTVTVTVECPDGSTQEDTHDYGVDAVDEDEAADVVVAAIIDNLDWIIGDLLTQCGEGPPVG